MDRGPRTGEWGGYVTLFLFSTTHCGGVASHGMSGSGGPGREGDAATDGPSVQDAVDEQAPGADASPAVVCPADEPTEGQPCPNPVPPNCWYGDSPRPECRDAWVCSSSNVWHATHQGCTAPPSGFCPTSVPSNTMSCSVSEPSESGANCAYPDGTLCTCECNISGGEGAGCVPTIFGCRPAPATVGCPRIVPNLGTPCMAQGSECVYGNPCVGGIAVFCRSALWTKDENWFCY